MEKKSNEPDLFNLLENIQKHIKQPEATSGVDLVKEKMAETGKEAAVAQPPQTLKLDGYEFPADFTVVALVLFAAMNNRKVNKIMKEANIRLFDLKGKKYFPRSSWFKRIIRKLASED